MPRPPRRISYRDRVLGDLPEPGLAMWSLYGRLVPADPDLFAELLALVQEDTGPSDDDDTPGRRRDIEILVEADGEPRGLIELRADGTIELEVLSPGASSR